MGHLEVPECLAVDNPVSHQWLWKAILACITLYWINVITRQFYNFCQHKLQEYISLANLKYDLLMEKLHEHNSELIVKLENLHSEITELKSGSDGLRSDLNTLIAQVATLKQPATGTSAPGGPPLPPPPPPPPPPFSLVTPSVKIEPPSSVKTEVPKKKQAGPPQFSISQADITKMLQKLKKTSSAARLLGSGTTQSRKTPPRRKLFGRTPGHSRRRSITALSPGSDVTIHKTPLSSISPLQKVDAELDGKGYEK